MQAKAHSLQEDAANNRNLREPDCTNGASIRNKPENELEKMEEADLVQQEMLKAAISKV